MFFSNKMFFILFAALCLEGRAAKPIAYHPYRETPSELTRRHCEKATTTPQTEQCTAEALAVLQGELTRVYRKIVDSLASYDMKSERKLLVAEQEAWVRLSEASAATEYQANIEGTIRGIAALVQKISDTHSRTQRLKRRYLSLFNEEITRSDLTGEWRGILGPNRILRLSADGHCSLEDPGASVKQGTCAINGISLKMIDGSGKTLIDEWIFVETASFGDSEFLVLQFLHGEGHTTEALVRK